VIERAQLFREPAPVLVAGVHRRERPLAGNEKAPLRVVVVLEGAMEVEVILAEVREGERGEPDAVETAELGAVRGRLERAAAIAAVEHLAERALEVDRLRRRPHRRPALAANHRLDRPEEAGASTG